MLITKFTHSCLFIQTVTPTERAVLFDPGSYSSYTEDSFTSLDDVFITHAHDDHMDVDRILQLQARFPHVRITAPPDAAVVLTKADVTNVYTTVPEGVHLFSAPHEAIRPFIRADPPQEYGYHYLDVLSHPGDSHSFQETKQILALPVIAPWGATVAAVQAALSLRPKYIIPIHDWHWHDEAREQMYARLRTCFEQEGIIFLPLQNGVPFELTIM